MNGAVLAYVFAHEGRGWRRLCQGWVISQFGWQSAVLGLTPGLRFRLRALSAELYLALWNNVRVTYSLHSLGPYDFGTRMIQDFGVCFRPRVKSITNLLLVLKKHRQRQCIT